MTGFPREIIEASTIAAGLIRGDVDWWSLETSIIWRTSRQSGVAVIIHPTVCEPDYAAGQIRDVPAHMTALQWYNYRIDSQRKENERRDRATLEICLLVLMGYIEGRDMYARKLGAAIGSHRAAYVLASDSVPSYTEMRNFLIGELDAHPVIAAAAAYRQTEFHNKLARRERANFYGDPPPDTGWI